MRTPALVSLVGAVLCLASQTVGSSGLLVSYAGGNFSLPSTKFGRYFGKQECGTISGPAAFLYGNDKLCGPPLEQNYNNTILIVYDMVYPVGKIEADGVEFDFGNVGCSKEAMYEKLATSGALAAVTMAIDPLPSTGEFLHGAAAHDAELYDRIPLLSIQIEDAMAISGLLANGEFVMLTVSCDDANPMVPYLLGMSAAGLIFGFADLVVGFMALTFAFQTEAAPCNPCAAFCKTRTGAQAKGTSTGASSSEHTSKRRGHRSARRMRIKRRKVYGQGQIMLVFAAVNLLSGFMAILGCNGASSHSFLVNDAVLHYGVKTFFSSGLAGFKMFCILLVAIFWYEMSSAMRSLRNVENIFRTYPIPIVVAGLSVILPDIVMSIIYASYLQVDIDVISWLYACTTFAVGVSFVISVNRMISQLQDHMHTIAPSAKDQPEAMSGVQRFALHMATWLRVFAFFSLLQFVLICVFLGGKLVFRSPQASLTAVILSGVAGIMSQTSQIIGLRGPVARSAASTRDNASLDLDDTAFPEAPGSGAIGYRANGSRFVKTTVTTDVRGTSTADTGGLLEDVDLELSETPGTATTA